MNNGFTEDDGVMIMDPIDEFVLTGDIKLPACSALMFELARSKSNNLGILIEGQDDCYLSVFLSV